MVVIILKRFIFRNSVDNLSSCKNFPCSSFVTTVPLTFMCNSVGSITVVFPLHNLARLNDRVSVGSRNKSNAKIACFLALQINSCFPRRWSLKEVYWRASPSLTFLGRIVKVLEFPRSGRATGEEGDQKAEGFYTIHET